MLTYICFFPVLRLLLLPVSDFVDNSVEHLTQVISGAAEEALKSPRAAGGATTAAAGGTGGANAAAAAWAEERGLRVPPPCHAAMHAQISRLSELLRVVNALDHSALAKLQMR